MMDSRGMVRDLVGGLYFTVTVMYIIGHGGMTYSWEGMVVCYSCFHLAHQSYEMDTLTECFLDSQSLLYIMSVRKLTN